MPECERLNGGSDWSDREVVERERTSTSISERDIRRHLGGVSTRIASQVRGELGVGWSHGAVHSRVQKADLQLTSDAAPNQIAVDETVSRPTGENDWLSAAVDPRTNTLLHVRLFRTASELFAGQFLRELRGQLPVEQAAFLVDGVAIVLLVYGGVLVSVL